MKLKIEIRMDNAAFEGDETFEVCRILKEYIEKMERTGNFRRALLDINGNVVGEAKRIG